MGGMDRIVGWGGWGRVDRIMGRGGQDGWTEKRWTEKKWTEKRWIEGRGGKRGLGRGRVDRGVWIGER